MLKWSAVLLLSVLSLTGCDTISYEYGRAQSGLKDLVKTDQADIANAPSRLVRATGYAPISLQPGQSRSQQIINAMKASKLQAYKEMATIVHGQYLYGTTQVNDMVVENEQFNAAVGGVIRGARVVKTYPIQEDTYATILELDLRDVQQAIVNAQ